MPAALAGVLRIKKADKSSADDQIFIDLDWGVSGDTGRKKWMHIQPNAIVGASLLSSEKIGLGERP